jgi:hypothetical protein
MKGMKGMKIMKIMKACINKRKENYERIEGNDSYESPDRNENYERINRL